jgi:predicted ATPase with chaperone activity
VYTKKITCQDFKKPGFIAGLLFTITRAEMMRQLIEVKIVTINRAQGSVTFPARLMFIWVIIPCLCYYQYR